jgi:CheY-like chemotaxis protein
MPSHLGQVVADPSQIEQAIINLVINARDAMPNGGTLTIRLMNTTIDEAAARQQTRLQPGHYVVLEVQDSGHGMTPEVQARLFDPFFTTKAVGEGTGLGLATVYGIVKQSGGFIEVESELTNGSTFRIFLPQSTPLPQDSQTATTYVRGGNETILLVEGDLWVRQSLRGALEAKGYRLLDAASGRGAISLCQGYVGQIHLLVVSEIKDMSGIALARQAHLFRPEMRVLLILENGEAGEMGERNGSPLSTLPYFFLNKPLSPEMLTAKVRSVLDTPASMTLL